LDQTTLTHAAADDRTYSTVFSSRHCSQLATVKLVVVLSCGKQPLIMSTINPDAKFKGFVGKEAGLADKFAPAIFETLGGFSKDSVAFIALIGKDPRRVCWSSGHR
jgi:hypothetical protein